MIKQFRFHSKDFSKDLTLTSDNDWQRYKLAEFLKNMDTDPGSVNDILDKVISDANTCKRYVDRRGGVRAEPVVYAVRR